MKKLTALSGFLALALFIGFSLSACDTTDDKGFINDIELQPFKDISAVELVGGMRVGWNLGNTLDAIGGETAWGNPKTTKANITALKDAGFNVIRIPVSWNNGADGKYHISSSWMRRVTEVVNYAVENDMYVILNSHHDNEIFKFTDKDVAASLTAFQKVWEQIADNFQNYNEKLIFEALNEPRTEDGQNEWNGGTAPERANLNKHYQAFADTVRASGGNNGKRFLLINAYAASSGGTAMNALALPQDSATDKLIVSFHAYAPYNFALNTGNGKTDAWSESNARDKSDITGSIDSYYNKFSPQHIPVIIGEFGAMNRNNVDTRAAWAKFYVSYAKSKGMPCVWWDNGVTSGSGELFGLLDRRTNKFTYPEIVEALMQGTK